MGVKVVNNVDVNKLVEGSFPGSISATLGLEPSEETIMAEIEAAEAAELEAAKEAKEMVD